MSAEKYLISIIQAQGPISIAQYMAIALSDSKYGYYTTSKPLGSKGDFVTAPEISQIFGELIGLWCVAVWEFMDKPDDLALIELGPGKGTLMSDLLRGIKNVKGFQDSISVHLIEISPTLRKQQEQTLSGLPIKIKWHDSLSDMPRKPVIIIGNEFFDALPILQFTKTENGWREKMVGIDDKENLSFVLSPAETPSCALIPKKVKDSERGAVYEICPSAITITKDVAEHIKKFGGAGLFIDYGYLKNNLEDSFQAVKGHNHHDVLKSPGEADLTAHVDFSILRKSILESGIMPYGPIGQGEFLQIMGIDLRTSMLLKNASSEQKKDIISGTKRLTDKDKMGELFKCIALMHPDLPAPPGFESDSVFEVK